MIKNDQSHVDSPNDSEVRATASTVAPVSHWPGPWTFYESDLSHEDLWFVVQQDTPDGSMPRIAEVYERANARLIAAAPKLLAVAREAGRIHVCCCTPRERSAGDYCLKCQSDAAIARAEGR